MQAKTEPPRKAIQVCCRVRPLSPKEGSDHAVENCITCLPDSIFVDPSVAQRHRAKNCRSRAFGHTNHDALKSVKQFSFDAVHNHHAPQHAVYDTSVKHIVQEAFKGVNGAVLAYGATGSGKTYTMLGTDHSAPGVIFLAINHILSMKQELEATGKVVTFSTSYFEVYNEFVYDLVGTKEDKTENRQTARETMWCRSNHKSLTTPQGKPRVALPLRESADGTKTEIIDLSRHPIQGFAEFKELIETGVRNRAVAETNANTASSRSHAILTIDIEVRENENAETGTIGTLKLCDLAGSERAAGNSNTAQTMKEGANINKSLLALGNVVQALSTAPTRNQQAYVPYRASKLTRLLKECLGGNCNTAMIICVSPSSKSIEETCNTLQYAMYAKKIQSVVTANEFAVVADLVRSNLEAAVEKLRAENAALKEEVCILARQAGDSHEPPVRRSGVARPPCHEIGLQCFLAEDGTENTPPQLPLLANFNALKEKYRQLCDKKEYLFARRRVVDESRDELLEVKIRACHFRIVELFAADPNSFTTQIPPVALAGLQQTISHSQGEIKKNKLLRQGIDEEILRVDAEIKSLAEGVASDDLKPLNELLLNNLMLRMNGLEAENYASSYSQWLNPENKQRENELEKALELATRAIRSLLDTLPAEGCLTSLQGAAKRTALEALAFAKLPDTGVENMLSEFRRATDEARENTPAPVTPAKSVRMDVLPSAGSMAKTPSSRSFFGKVNAQASAPSSAVKEGPTLPRKKSIRKDPHAVLAPLAIPNKVASNQSSVVAISPRPKVQAAPTPGKSQGPSPFCRSATAITHVTATLRRLKDLKENR